MPLMMRRDGSRNVVSVPTQSLAPATSESGCVECVKEDDQREMRERRRTAPVMNEIIRYNINTLGLSEVRWTDSGKKGTFLRRNHMFL